MRHFTRNILSNRNCREYDIFGKVGKISVKYSFLHSPVVCEERGAHINRSMWLPEKNPPFYRGEILVLPLERGFLAHNILDHFLIYGATPSSRIRPTKNHIPCTVRIDNFAFKFLVFAPFSSNFTVSTSKSALFSAQI